MEVEIDHGRVIPREEDTLPEHGRALLTILDTPTPEIEPAKSCDELADRWPNLSRLSPEEGSAFADDIEAARRNLPPLESKWD